MIRFYIRAYDTSTGSARRDATKARTEITSRIKSASWMFSTSQPYEQATIRTTIRADELDVLGLGLPIVGTDRTALHCSGWLEIDDDGERVFIGMISRVKTGLRLGNKGERVSQGVELSAVSWIMLMGRPYRLTSNSRLTGLTQGLLEYDKWASIFESVFSAGSAVDVAEGIKTAWATLATFSLPTGDNLATIPVIIDPTSNPLRGRALPRVKGANISQVPVNMSGSLWGTFVQTFQPAPELIDLFPTWQDGRPYIVYRMRPLPPLDDRGVRTPNEHFETSDILNVDDNNLTVQINSHTTDEYQLIDRVLAYSVSYSDQRNNYIEVSSSYLGVSQLAGLNSSPIALRDDITRYGLSPLEITYPLLRNEKNSPKIATQLEDLTRYASALHGDAHAYATGSIDTMYQPQILAGEWANWYDSTTNDLFTGYVTAVSHTLTIDTHGTQQKRTSIQLERVSLFGRRSVKKLISEVTK